MMSDSDAAPPSPSSPSQSQRRTLWARIKAPFTAERIIATFTVVLAVATLALVIVAYIQHIDSIDAIETTRRLG